MPVPQLRRLLATMLALAFSTAPAAARVRDPNATPLRSIFLTKPAPDFMFDLGTGPRRLRELAGKPVVVNVWDTYCQPCTAEMAAFAKIAPAYGSAVGVLTVNDEAPGKALDYLKKQALDLPVVEDPARNIFGLYSIVPIPVTILVARDGTVAKVIVGELEWDELRGDIEAELARPPGPDAAAH